MTSAAKIIRTSLMLGTQLDALEFRAFLRDYHRDLRQRFPNDSLPAYSPTIVLESLIPRYEHDPHTSPAWLRYEALRAAARRQYHLQLGLAMADHGPFERRVSPYHIDRAVYLLGEELAHGTMSGTAGLQSPYRSLRRLNIPALREGMDWVMELLPDYMWWALHDQRHAVRNALAPELLHQVRDRIERAGFQVESFGLYLSTFELITEEAQPPGEPER